MGRSKFDIAATEGPDKDQIAGSVIYQRGSVSFVLEHFGKIEVDLTLVEQDPAKSSDPENRFKLRGNTVVGDRPCVFTASYYNTATRKAVVQLWNERHGFLSFG